MTWKDLISEAELNFGFVTGHGLGSFLLAIVLIVFFLSHSRNDAPIRQIMSILWARFSRRP